MIVEKLLMGLIKLFVSSLYAGVLVNCIKFEEKEFGVLGYVDRTYVIMKLPKLIFFLIEVLMLV